MWDFVNSAFFLQSVIDLVFLFSIDSKEENI